MLKDVLEIALRKKARTVTASCGRTTEREFFKTHQGNMTVEPVGTTSGMGGKTGLYALPIPHYAEPTEFKDGKPIKARSYVTGKEYTVYEVKDGYFTYKDKKYPLKVEDGFYIIRKLTVEEVKLLQTVPLDYDFPVSDTQAYKMLGNGWTVEVISHILKEIGDDLSGMKSKRTKALEIPKEIKEAVAKRDTFNGWTCCVLCGTPAPPENPLAFSNAHFVPRSKGGLGIEKNIVSLCPHCHRQYDQSTERSFIRAELKNYLKSKYDDWNEEDLIYRR